MGTFRVPCVVQNHVRRDRQERVPGLLVDTGSECTWIPRAVLERIGVRPEKRISFRMVDGRVIARDVGYALVRAAGRVTTDEVVFATPRDIPILGARTLEGLNVRVDAARKRLVASGPMPAAGAA
ncbi:MAG: hypothetical protein HY608_11520 [Planctomycetes bacterium]|nr:hypothetical protein [Planctomycetota bacterium]